MKIRILIFPVLLIFAGCAGGRRIAADALKPAVVTEQVMYDTDDPAIWINADNPAASLVIGTDKDSDGALYVFDLSGKIVNKVGGLKRPNNTDIAYGLLLNGKKVDIAVLTERETNRIRVFSLPGLEALDNGGIEVFSGETLRDPMGIALYTRPSDHTIYAVVGRKTGPSGSYLWQYRLEDNGQGAVKGTVMRKFGKYSGKKEIESIAVDNEMGYIYYSDEGAGIHKYYADEEKGNEELAFFGTKDFKADIEGISIYKSGKDTGYILVSDQQANRFSIYDRKGSGNDPHGHVLLKSVPFSTLESDGSEVTQQNLGDRFPRGMFVAMSNGKVFHYYDWRLIEARIGSTK